MWCESRNANNVTGQISGLAASRDLVTADGDLRPGGEEGTSRGKLSRKPTLLYTDEQSRVVMMRAQPMS